MTDDQLIAVSAIRDPKGDLRDCDDADYESNITMLKILADAFVELMMRQGMKPKFERGHDA